MAVFEQERVSCSQTNRFHSRLQALILHSDMIKVQRFRIPITQRDTVNASTIQPLLAQILIDTHVCEVILILQRCRNQFAILQLTVRENLSIGVIKLRGFVLLLVSRFTSDRLVSVILYGPVLSNSKVLDCSLIDGIMAATFTCKFSSMFSIAAW